MDATAIAAVVGWALAALFLVLWLVSNRLRDYAIYDREAALLAEMTIAVEFANHFVSPGRKGAFDAIEFMLAWVRRDRAAIEDTWPQWRPYLAARRAGRKWVPGA
ncbi:hypothetical protein QWJ46_16920 [Rhizobium sp. CBN3]|uniref:hypothetical protein n=1 Tax=Rhizobium sp. CBN3 TaxID=3058045 RepID=UPI002673186E|nr:hypothetical protein [Rhizobium sp. CBN3]MDO3434364.1 hypothetical protein [Rhizobium sp. CBN3]